MSSPYSNGSAGRDRIPRDPPGSDEPGIGLRHHAVDPEATAFPDHVVDRLDALAVGAADLDAQVHVAVRSEAALRDVRERRAGDLGIAALHHLLERLAIEHLPDRVRREGVRSVVVVAPKCLELLYDRLRRGRRVLAALRLRAARANSRTRRDEADDQHGERGDEEGDEAGAAHRRQCITEPPSTFSAWPVMLRA